jgi:hypothetical protein
VIFVKLALIIFIIFALSTSQESIDEDILITDNPLDTNVKVIDTTHLKDPERLYLVATDFSLPLHGTFTLIFQRTIKHSRTLGITGVLSDEIRKPGLYAISFYLGMNFYSKKAFNGWYIAPTIGYKRIFKESQNICFNLHGGYKWELPHTFLIGFGIGPGIYGAVFREKNMQRFGIDFLGGFYLGKAFGLLTTSRK